MFSNIDPEAIVIKLFQCNYATISVTSVKFMSKYADSGTNYKEKSFITLAPVAEFFFDQGLIKNLKF